MSRSGGFGCIVENANWPVGQAKASALAWLLHSGSAGACQGRRSRREARTLDTRKPARTLFVLLGRREILPNMVEGRKCPGMSNTGAQITCENGLVAGVDWVQGTFTFLQDWRVFVEEILAIPSSEFQEVEGGMFGWGGQAFCGRIRVLFGGNQPGVHLVMSGQACREYENYVSDWLGFFERFLLRGGKLTRLDLAIDDTKGYFTLDKVRRYLKNGQTVSLFKSARVIEKIKVEDGTNEGTTIYFGSGQSKIQVRFYEKDKERIARGYSLKEKLDVWNRTEIQLRDERANEVAFRLLGTGDIGRIITGILRHYIRFCKKSRDSNQTRWETADWWERFLGDSENLKIAKRMPETDLVMKDNWVEKQISRLLAQLWLGNDGKLDRIIEILELGADKLTEIDLKKIEMWKESYKQYLQYKEREKVFKLSR